jgi:hypothetical protein
MLDFRCDSCKARIECCRELRLEVTYGYLFIVCPCCGLRIKVTIKEDGKIEPITLENKD